MSDASLNQSSVAADLMAALRFASHALALMRESDVHTVAQWVKQLPERDQFDLILGLVVMGWWLIDPATEAAYMLRMEVDLPSPTERVTAAQLEAGDIVRVVVDPEVKTAADLPLRSVIAQPNGFVELHFDDGISFTTLAAAVVARRKP